MRRLVVPLVLVVALATACSSGKSTSKGSTGPSTTYNVNQGWTPAAVTTMRNLAIRLQKAVPGACPDVQLLPHDQFVVAAQRLNLEPPLAVVDCQISGATAELNVFGSTITRDRYMNLRTNVLCQGAARDKVNVAGLHWVLGDNYSIQLQSEGPAHAVATAMNGTYSVKPCQSGANINWDAAGEARVNELAAQLAARPTIKCTSNQLLDRQQYLRDARYKGRVPAAYSECHGPAGIAILIAAFNSHTVTPAKFIGPETKIACGSGPGVAGVLGSDFVLVISNVKVAALAAVATGGKVQPPAC